MKSFLLSSKEFLSKKWAFPLILFFTFMVSFGTYISDLGFYWDDWPNIFVALNGKQSIFADLYAPDRPLNSLIYNITFPILGYRPLSWHLFSISLHWLSAISMWLLLKKIWPDRKFETSAAPLLFAIYPSFTQQHISVVFMQHFIAYSLFFLSLWLMLKALDQHNHYGLFTVLSLIASLLQLATVEYFIGLELLRPLIIYLYLSNSEDVTRTKPILVIKRWLPYLSVLVAFSLWRFLLLDLPDDQNSVRLLTNFRLQPLGAMLNYLQSSAQDFIFVSVSSWYSTLQPEIIDFSDLSQMFSFGLGILVAFTVFIYLISQKTSDKEFEQKDNTWSKQAIFLGVAAIFLGMLPARITDRDLLIGLYANRFTLPALFGAAVFWVGISNIALKDYLYRSLFIVILVGLAVGFHVRTSNEYRVEWIRQIRFYDQLVQRAPGIQSGTALIMDGGVSTRVADYVASAALNTLYPQREPINVDLWVFQFYRGIHLILEDFSDDVALKGDYRSLSFSGNSLDSLLIYNHPEEGACLWIISTQDSSNIELPEEIRQIAPYSNLQRIQFLRTVFPVQEIFDIPLPPYWCQLFQRAALAAQYLKWEEVVAIENQARMLGFDPNRGAEYLPFIQAHAALNEWSVAAELTALAYEKSFTAQALLCSIWDEYKLSSTESADFSEALLIVKTNVFCP